MRKLGKAALFAVAALAAVAAVGFYVVRSLRQPPESRIFLNGTVLTMDAHDSIAQAVALARDRIVAVGTNEEVQRLVAKGSIVVDLHGQTMLPGFIDAHGHFPGSGLAAIAVDLNSPPIGAIKDIPAAIAALQAKARATRRGRWVVGYGYDDMALAEGRHFTRADLDRVSVDHPVYAWHISGHTAVVNSVALKLLGITATTPDPPGGVIHKDPATHEPTGRLEETAHHAAMKQTLALSFLEGVKAARYATAEYAAAGVTTAQVGLADEKMFTAVSRLSTLGLISQRLIVWPDAALGERIVAGALDPGDFNSDGFHVGAVKLVADGSIYIYTAYLSEPYTTPYRGDAGYRAYPTHSRDELTKLVSKFHTAGLQVAIHGNGDAAIDDIIVAIAAAQQASPRPDARHLIVHAQTARLDQLDAMKALGISPTYHNPHVFYFADRHWDVFLGPGRTARISPLKSTLDRGVRFSIHTDTPVLPISPLMAVWCAVQRRSAAGRLIGPAERIAPMAALRAVTIDAAWQVFQEDNRGSIEKGKYADLVILSDNPVAHPDAIREMKVLETITGGRTIYAMR
ncbi:MAG: amidohydrolase [Deltaproteobacteria bacterium]|nr:amidohydrolase [Deltaproteobacteria bacterium]